MIPFVSVFLARLRNARNVVRQIKKGEWRPIYNTSYDGYLKAERDGYRLWPGNGSFFCEVDEFNGVQCKPAFGLIFRHYVWFAAARKLRSNANAKTHFPIL